MRVLDLAHDLANQSGDPRPLARIHTLRASSYWYAGEYEKATEEARTGLEAAGRTGDRTWEAACHHTLGAVAFRRLNRERFYTLVLALVVVTGLASVAGGIGLF